MKRRITIALLAVFALAIASMLGACGSNGKSANEAASSEAASSSAAASNEYSGELVIAYQHELVLSGEDGEMEFVTDEDTVYNMGDVGAMYLDDVLSVKYHEGDDGNIAEEVNLVEHMDTALEYAGTLVDSNDDSITLVNKGISATFQIDSDSYIVGDLSQGDEIELTYLGDINEYPYANVVAVVTEAEAPQANTIRGTVSELYNGTLLLSIDSAHAYRFVITSSTDIGGAADDIAVGDQVEITYQGSVTSQPNALSVKVVKASDQRVYVINGTIESVSSNSIVLNTGVASYAIATTSNTKFYGEQPAQGYLAKITYTGSLISNPEATIVYCAKSAKEANKATAKKQESKSDSKSNNSSAQKDDSKQSSGNNSAKQDDSSSKKTDEKATESSESSAQKTDIKPEAASEQSPEPEDETADETKKQPEPEPEADDQSDEGSEPEEEVVPEPEDEGAGESGEEPAPEPEADDQSDEGSEPEEEVAPEPEPEDEAAAEPEEEAVEPEEEAVPEEEVADEPEEEAAPEPAPEMVVSGKGTIVKDDTGNKVLEVEMKNGKKLKFKYDNDTKISSGYTPQKGDVIKIEYGSDSLILKDIQLVSRDAEPEDE